MDLALLVFFALVVLAAMSGAAFPPGEWYERLAKPSWRPANWVFPVVWSVLYALMAFAAWRVWHAAPEGRLGLAMAAWGGQLLLNAGWSWLFFGLKRMRLALAELALLWLAVALTTAIFATIDFLAAVLLLPYIAWVSIAAVLNASMIRLNPEV